jgi:DNA-directed RNA polymerase subunit RPC12/RpoP
MKFELKNPFCKHEYEEKEHYKKLICKKCGSEIMVKV